MIRTSSDTLPRLGGSRNNRYVLRMTLLDVEERMRQGGNGPSRFSRTHWPMQPLKHPLASACFSPHGHRLSMPTAPVWNMTTYANFIQAWSISV